MSTRSKASSAIPVGVLSPKKPRTSPRLRNDCINERSGIISKANAAMLSMVVASTLLAFNVCNTLNTKESGGACEKLATVLDVPSSQSFSIYARRLSPCGSLAKTPSLYSLRLRLAFSRSRSDLKYSTKRSTLPVFGSMVLYARRKLP